VVPLSMCAIECQSIKLSTLIYMAQSKAVQTTTATTIVV